MMFRYFIFFASTAVMNKHNKQSGFTLIELMIVVAILAILIAYALPAYRDYSVRAKLTEGNAMAAAYKAAVNQGFIKTGTLAGLNNGTHGIAGAASTGTCVETIEVVDGQITISFDCLAGSEGQADPVVDISQIQWFSVITASNTVQWSCNALVPRPDQNPC